LLLTNGSKTKETATFSSLLWYRRNKSFYDLEPLSVDTMTLATCGRVNVFTFGNA
jgi:hypothetical protein